jgi:hypothetical protein
MTFRISKYELNELEQDFNIQQYKILIIKGSLCNLTKYIWQANKATGNDIYIFLTTYVSSIYMYFDTYYSHTM